MNPPPISKTMEANFKHGHKYESIARTEYTKLMKEKLKREVIVRATGTVVQPNLYWLAASPDGMVSDPNDPNVLGLLEIKCPISKRDILPADLVKDEKFYVRMDGSTPYLNKKHAYYTQIQMAMGLSGVKFCFSISVTLSILGFGERG